MSWVLKQHSRTKSFPVFFFYFLSLKLSNYISTELECCLFRGDHLLLQLDIYDQG